MSLRGWWMTFDDTQRNTNTRGALFTRMLSTHSPQIYIKVIWILLLLIYTPYMLNIISISRNHALYFLVMTIRNELLAFICFPRGTCLAPHLQSWIAFESSTAPVSCCHSSWYTWTSTYYFEACIRLKYTQNSTYEFHPLVVNSFTQKHGRWNG